MIGKSLTASIIPGAVVGVVYLTIIMWWQSGYTPMDLVEVIVQPLQQITEALK